MKKHFITTGLILFLLAVSFPGCEEEKTTEELLIGKWKMVTEHYADYENGLITDEDTYDYDPNEGAIEFLKSGTGKVYEDGVVEETFSWEISGDVLIITITGDEDYPIEMDFTVSESKLTLKFSFEYTYEGVVYKTETELILKR